MSIPTWPYELQQCVDYGRHLPQTRHTRDTCPALMPLPVEDEEPMRSPYPDMTETFQREAEVADAAATLYPFGRDLPDRIVIAMREGFRAGAYWGSKPF